MVKIYTKKGDKGKTYLINGEQVFKNDLRLEAYGTIDELNSAISIAIAEISNIKNSAFVPLSGTSVDEQILNITNDLIQIQNDLFEIGSTLANPTLTEVRNLNKRVLCFEQMIDSMSIQLPELKNFILPNGGLTGSCLHFARTVCRRAERKVVEFTLIKKIDQNILVYLNRLSDLLFVMARYVNHLENKKEIIWKSKH